MPYMRWIAVGALSGCLLTACGGGGGGSTAGEATTTPTTTAALAYRLADTVDAAKPDYVKAMGTLSNGNVAVTLIQSDTIVVDDWSEPLGLDQRVHQN